ncbi:ras-related protein Rab-28-like [Zerene cesonia]|uniref:ras-related protein Rab-28-like n=1 Tax=Zerene cesonia TaxID=33412 RepID=UPI0018E5A77B|nr:ras-related protein Rab-28-like [Zerene cesonia]
MFETIEDEDEGRTIKITVLGEPSTGKTCLCNRYLGGSGTSPASTHGAEVTAGQCLGLRPAVPFQLCDVAGNSLATSMLTNYLYASDIVLFVYDLTNLQSFERLDVWLSKVQDVYKHETKKPCMAIFGNKSDLEHQRAVRLSCVQTFATKHGLESFKGSARTGELVNIAITSLIARVLGSKMVSILAADEKPTGKQIQISQVPPEEVEIALPLIMSRKSLRKVQRKESSSVCELQ